MLNSDLRDNSLHTKQDANWAPKLSNSLTEVSLIDINEL